MSKQTRCHIYLLSVLFLTHFNQSTPGLRSDTNFHISYKCFDWTSCDYKFLGKSRSKIKCAAMCGREEKCAAFKFYSQDTRCYLLEKPCLRTDSCERTNPEPMLYEKQILNQTCLNGGIWNFDLQACICVDFWVGQYCERRPYFCGELYRYWYGSGPHRDVLVDVFRDGSRFIPTMCSYSSSNAYTYIFMSTGKPDHNKTWQEYADGYTLDDYNRWLGLQNVVAFNRMGHSSVAFVLSFQDDATGDKAVWWYFYDSFIIGDASTGYRFSCTLRNPGITETGQMKQGYVMSNVLGMSQGVPFSAPDLDRDNDADHCASKAGRGWWFDTCNPHKDMNTSINPLGWNTRDYPGPPTDQHIWIPGVDMKDPLNAAAFKTCHFYFVDPRPSRP